MAYTSLFLKNDVRITQAFSSSHKGLDLSRGVVRQPIYLPNRAVEGEVWKILVGYSSHGVFYDNAPIVYVKHKDGSGSRYIHSALGDVKVKVGDKLRPGDRICSTGVSGHVTADHLHFEWLTKWDDLNTRVDPEPFVMNDGGTIFNVGDTVVFTGVQHIRKGAGDKFMIQRGTVAGEVAKIKDGPRTSQNEQFGLGQNDNYIWWDMEFSNGTGWVADVRSFEIYKEPETPPVSPPSTPNCEEYIKQIDTLKQENSSLVEAQRASQERIKSLEERVKFLEDTLKLRDEEMDEGDDQLDRVIEERDTLKKQNEDLQYELSQLKNRWGWLEKFIEWVNNLLKKDNGR